MAVMEILKFNHPVLRKKTKEVKTITPEIKKLVSDMIETMYSANGVGLSSNQVGSLERVMVMDVSPERNSPLVLFNPKIIKKSGKIFEIEGCLSFPGLNFKIKRAKKIEVTGLDINFNQIKITAEDLPARVIQHEVDHLLGIVFIDRLPIFERIKIKNEIKKIVTEK